MADWGKLFVCFLALPLGVLSLSDDDIELFNADNVTIVTDGGIHTFSSTTHGYAVTIYQTPLDLDSPGCLLLDQIIGIAVDGNPFYGPYSRESDAGGKNVVEGDYLYTESAGECGLVGTGVDGATYYRQVPTCLLDVSNPDPQLIGIALDGYPIYAYPPENEPANLGQLLDECNGMVESGSYRYYGKNAAFPYIVGCLKARMNDTKPGVAGGPPGGAGGGPPGSGGNGGPGCDPICYFTWDDDQQSPVPFPESLEDVQESQPNNNDPNPKLATCSASTISLHLGLLLLMMITLLY